MVWPAEDTGRIPPKYQGTVPRLERGDLTHYLHGLPVGEMAGYGGPVRAPHDALGPYGLDQRSQAGSPDRAVAP